MTDEAYEVLKDLRNDIIERMCNHCIKLCDINCELRSVLEMINERMEMRR